MGVSLHVSLATQVLKGFIFTNPPPLNRGTMSPHWIPSLTDSCFPVWYINFLLLQEASMGVRLHQPAQCNAFGGTVYSRHLPGQGDPGDQLVQPDEIASHLCNAHNLT